MDFRVLPPGYGQAFLLWPLLSECLGVIQRAIDHHEANAVGVGNVF